MEFKKGYIMKRILCIFMAIIINLQLCVYAETVVYNPNSGIYHKVTCQHAKRCKKCIKIEKKEAQQQGGRPCKNCGG